MEVKEESISETVTEIPQAIDENSEIKIPNSRVVRVSADRTVLVQPIRKITIRQSTDSPTRTQANYEIITQCRIDKHQEVTSQFSPTVELQRYDLPPAESPKDKALNNGLDPIGIELISSASLTSSKAGSEYSDKTDDIHVPTRVSREMKNLQKSKNESKILSDYLNALNESPRSRSRKNKDPPLADPDEEEEDIKEIDTESQSPIPSLKDANDSESTLSMIPPGTRYKVISCSRNWSRTRSRSMVRSRKKSAVRIMNEELLGSSDKEEVPEDEEEDQLSEVSFVTNQSLDGRAVNPPPRPGWDSFCFKCHTDTAVLSLACSKCKCSYHRHCVRPNPIPKNVDEFECPECRELEAAQNSNVNKYGHEKIDPNALGDMLMIIVEKIRTYPDREHFENEIVVKGLKETTQPFIVTQMSLKILEMRIKTHVYTTTEAFVHDIKQLEHNWNVVDRSKSKTLKSIVKYVNSEINELEACVYCYEKSFVTGDWFVQPCKRLHLLIWAKLKGYPYWPAKVMSVDTRQHVDVRFFGAHDRAWVPATHCILFSEKDPNKTKGSTPTNNKSTSKNQKGIADAMKEKDDYIENLRLKYGFKYSPCRTQFDPNHLQSQLEFMLPGLKDPKDLKEGQNGGEKEIDGAQKEKLTLKIIKGQSSNYQVEQKTAEQRTPSIHKQTEKDKPKLYKVLSKNDDNPDQEQSGRLFPLIIKRKSNVEQETEKTKKPKASDNTSETSTSNATDQSGKGNSRRRSTRDSGKHKRLAKNADMESPPEPPAKKPKHNDKQKAATEEGQPNKPGRRPRAKSVMAESEKPLLVPLIAPPGTNEIQALKEASMSPQANIKRKQKRSQSFQRSRSTEKEVTNDVNPPRRLSIGVAVIKRSLSMSTRKNSQHESTSKPIASEDKAEKQNFDPNIVIKDEPVSDSEEIEQRDAFTLSDIPNLIQNKSGKKKLIVISTNEGVDFSSASDKGKARKTFPNPPSLIQMEAFNSQQQQMRNGDWMVCIPQTFSPQASTSAGQGSTMQSPPTSNRSTPSVDSQAQMRSNVTVSRGTVPNTTINNNLGSNRSFNSNIIPPLSYNISTSNTLNRRNSIHSNPVLVNGQRVNMNNVTPPNFTQQRNHQQDNNPPRLFPRPQGVFVNDGTAFHRDNGPVSRLLTDNAHRMSDYFRNILIDTVTSFASEVPAAENLMLRAENEKIHREMQTTKAECQQKMHELRREHQDEIETIKKECEERLKILQNSVDQEKARLINEIRHQCELEKQRAIDITRKETKKTTWCSNCTKEARFYCCWNTSYCSLQCQRNHWQIHQRCCANKNSVNDTVQPGNPEPVVSTPHVSRPLILRGPQQLQQSAAVISSAPAVSIHQHIIVPPSIITSSGTSGVIDNAAITTQPIILNTYQNKNRAIQTIYHEHAVREAIPSNLIVKTIRHEAPNSSITSSQITVTNSSVPAMSRE